MAVSSQVDSPPVRSWSCVPVVALDQPLLVVADACFVRGSCLRLLWCHLRRRAGEVYGGGRGAVGVSGRARVRGRGGIVCLAESQRPAAGTLLEPPDRRQHGPAYRTRGGSGRVAEDGLNGAVERVFDVANDARHDMLARCRVWVVAAEISKTTRTSGVRGLWAAHGVAGTRRCEGAPQCTESRASSLKIAITCPLRRPAPGISPNQTGALSITPINCGLSLVISPCVVAQSQQSLD
jgi:hypothetical protein